MNLSLFQKPSRYINKELNSIYKEAPIKIALAFPDTYEIGMSHLGLKILYKIINDIPYASAERVFAPWHDLEIKMKENNIPLCTLESGTPLNEFDIVGFSLQYELSYTTVLNMLKLGGIPHKSEDRSNTPIIIAGGPCTVNPLPMSEFIDAFLIGDGEFSINKIIETYYLWKINGDKRKDTLLYELSKIGGMYVPSIQREEHTVKRHFIKSLDSAPYPDNPVIPYMTIIHDRLNIEVSRGCSMGCRFCQAGMIYRPVRERSPENVLNIAIRAIKNTGFEEVAFTSLSAGDYTHLIEVTRTFNKLFREKKIALSLPSLRVSAINRDLLREIKNVRKTGFTIAPEAGTDRLRKVINKDFSEDDFEKAVNILFSEGWQNLKLYFMIGLPTETQEDIDAIYKLSIKALKIAKKHIKSFVNINIGISPFIPKPHTPFQWICQESIEELNRKKEYLKNLLIKKGFNIRDHNTNMSLLECALSRGDKNISYLIESAWKLGCYLDSWTEIFDFNKWFQAMELTGIDAYQYARKVYNISEKLPWDFIDTGIKKEYLQKEYKKALSEEGTIDCRKICHDCGIMCLETKKDSRDRTYIRLGEDFNNKSKLFKDSNQNETTRIRVEFSKTGILKYLSHLELIKLFHRAIRRADFPVVYTKGYHPRPKISFGPPLNVGIEGLSEYYDMVVFLPFDINESKEKLNNTLPEGISIIKMSQIPINTLSLNSFIKRYEYIIKGDISDNFNKFINEKMVLLKRGSDNIDLIDFLEKIENVDNSCYKIIIVDKDNVKVRLNEIINSIFIKKAEELEIKRIAMYGWDNGWKKPL